MLKHHRFSKTNNKLTRGIEITSKALHFTAGFLEDKFPLVTIYMAISAAACRENNPRSHKMGREDRWRYDIIMTSSQLLPSKVLWYRSRGHPKPASATAGDDDGWYSDLEWSRREFPRRDTTSTSGNISPFEANQRQISTCHSMKITNNIKITKLCDDVFLAPTEN